MTRFYDRAIDRTMREPRWRPLLADRLAADVPTGGTVVDIGTGTGTLALAFARARPDAQVVAVDGDPEVLASARAKAGAEAVQWALGLADALPLPEASADAAVQSLLLHHLRPEGKRAALAEVARVLKAGGALHVADWGRPATPVLHAGFLALQVLDGFPNTRDHRAGRLPAVLRAAGFSQVERYRTVSTVWGTLELLRATR